jgi:hypothetical protein
VAVLDPNVPAPSDLTVPTAPAGTENPDLTGDVSTQLGETDYAIASAEAATGKSVIVVIPRPYFVDTSGAVHAGTLNVTGQTSLVASGGSGGRAMFMNILAKHRAPSGAPSWFVEQDPAHVVNEVTRFGKVFANGQPNEDRVLYTDWGSAHKFANQYGAQHFGFNYPNDLVRSALRGAADGYAQNYDFKGSVRIVYGNNNNMDSVTTANANAAGAAQAHAAKVLADYEQHRARNSRLWYRKENAGVGGDIEPQWALSDPGPSKHLVNGAAQGGGGRYFDDGTANLANIDGQTNHWSVSDFCEVAFSIGGHRSPIPEIYHSSQIDDWEHLRQNCHSANFFYAGITWAGAPGWSTYSSPRSEWKALDNHTPAPVHHQLLNFVNAPAQ